MQGQFDGNNNMSEILDENQQNDLYRARQIPNKPFKEELLIKCV